MTEGLICSPRSGDGNHHDDNWAFEDVGSHIGLLALGPHSDFAGPTSGSTACVAVLRGNQLVVANAGDSRCVILRKGQAYNLSRAHKPELEAERERILKAGGFIHAGRVELCEDDDFIVLACDGVWDFMSSQQLVDFGHEQLSTETELSTVCERVLDRCLAPSTAGGEGCDNMTVILVQFKKPLQNGAVSSDLEPSPSMSLKYQQVLKRNPNRNQKNTHNQANVKSVTLRKESVISWFWIPWI
ncbi:hypothetical protein Cgig2_006703 [Carnegiea gigantea]|uniref:PPM-type phosphatase domain-containing protein n=1 Tax=Carnegiea gigantea TaxID=171969 RepID=A0A9Q1JSN4_9CARY|nr:hypothetical protein Cgig2_006703 [Carnegiea gigantea]